MDIQHFHAAITIGFNAKAPVTAENGAFLSLFQSRIPCVQHAGEPGIGLGLELDLALAALGRGHVLRFSCCTASALACKASVGRVMIWVEVLRQGAVNGKIKAAARSLMQQPL